MSYVGRGAIYLTEIDEYMGALRWEASLHGAVLAPRQGYVSLSRSGTTIAEAVENLKAALLEQGIELRD